MTHFPLYSPPAGIVGMSHTSLVISLNISSSLDILNPWPCFFGNIWRLLTSPCCRQLFTSWCFWPLLLIYGRSFWVGVCLQREVFNLRKQLYSSKTPTARSFTVSRSNAVWWRSWLEKGRMQQWSSLGTREVRIKMKAKKSRVKAQAVAAVGTFDCFDRFHFSLL